MLHAGGESHSGRLDGDAQLQAECLADQVDVSPAVQHHAQVIPHVPIVAQAHTPLRVVLWLLEESQGVALRQHCQVLLLRWLSRELVWLVAQ
jgi:hypothetical protein